MEAELQVDFNMILKWANIRNFYLFSFKVTDYRNSPLTNDLPERYDQAQLWSPQRNQYLPALSYLQCDCLYIQKAMEWMSYIWGPNGKTCKLQVPSNLVTF